MPKIPALEISNAPGVPQVANRIDPNAFGGAWEDLERLGGVLSKEAREFAEHTQRLSQIQQLGEYGSEAQVRLADEYNKALDDPAFRLDPDRAQIVFREKIKDIRDEYEQKISDREVKTQFMSQFGHGAARHMIELGNAARRQSVDRAQASATTIAGNLEQIALRSGSYETAAEQIRRYGLYLDGVVGMGAMTAEESTKQKEVFKDRIGKLIIMRDLNNDPVATEETLKSGFYEEVGILDSGKRAEIEHAVTARADVHRNRLAVVDREALKRAQEERINATYDNLFQMFKADGPEGLRAAAGIVRDAEKVKNLEIDERQKIASQLEASARNMDEIASKRKQANDDAFANKMLDDLARNELDPVRIRGANVDPKLKEHFLNLHKKGQEEIRKTRQEASRDAMTRIIWDDADPRFKTVSSITQEIGKTIDAGDAKNLISTLQLTQDPERSHWFKQSVEYYKERYKGIPQMQELTQVFARNLDAVVKSEKLTGSSIFDRAKKLMDQETKVERKLLWDKTQTFQQRFIEREEKQPMERSQDYLNFSMNFKPFKDINVPDAMQYQIAKHLSENGQLAVAENIKAFWERMNLQEEAESMDNSLRTLNEKMIAPVDTEAPTLTENMTESAESVLTP